MGNGQDNVFAIRRGLLYIQGMHITSSCQRFCFSVGEVFLENSLSSSTDTLHMVL